MQLQVAMNDKAAVGQMKVNIKTVSDLGGSKGSMEPAFGF